MAAVSEEDLQKKRDQNARLREQIAAAEAQADERVREQSNAIEAAQLDAENARLEAQLAAAKEKAKVSAAKGGAEAPLEAAKEQLEAAKAGITPAGVTVDTNANAETGSDPDSKKNDKE